MTTPTLSTIPLADVTRAAPAAPRGSVAASALREQASHVVWAPVVAGLWSASDAIGHVGLVEQRAQAYTAIDGRGHALGTFPARRDAEAAVEAAARRSG